MLICDCCGRKERVMTVWFGEASEDWPTGVPRKKDLCIQCRPQGGVFYEELSAKYADGDSIQKKWEKDQGHTSANYSDIENMPLDPERG